MGSVSKILCLNLDILHIILFQKAVHFDDFMDGVLVSSRIVDMRMTARKLKSSGES